MPNLRRLLSGLLLASACLLAAGTLQPASAQYFGRNKVQYRDLDFRVLKTEHFDVYHYESEAKAAVQAARMAERWYARLSRILDHELGGRQPIVLYDSHPAFEQTNAVPGQIGESTGGVTEALKRRVVLPLGASMAESDHVLGHELVHAFQFDITGQGPNAVGPDVPVALRMPLWFIEGMAEYLSVGSEDAFTGEWLRGAVMAEELPDWGDLGKPRYFPYRYGHALWAYLGGRFGDDAVGRLLNAAAVSRDMRQAFGRVLGVHPDSLIADWHDAIRTHQGPVLEATRTADAFARELVSEERGGTRQNLAPSLSPDGRLMVFASERNLFSIELFVADARTGEVLRKLTRTARDPHFESLQWINSSGAWSPDGRRFALAAVARGRAVVSIFDPRNGDKLRELRVPEVGEIFGPTWSPDGSRIAFSAQTAGFTDLWILDLETEEARRLTRDAYADLQPAWSPDGSRIAFATDRFTTDLERLRPGDYRLALADPETGTVEPVPGFPTGKHINPQWSPDAGELYFLSDRSGVTDLYRVELADGALHRVTSLKTGISGISALSPSLSVAREAGSAVFSVHGEGNFVFDLFAVDDPARLAGTPVEETPELADLRPAGLPPTDRVLNRVDRLLADAEIGLPDPLTFEREDYEPSLSLDFVGRPNLAVGANQFGFAVGGGGSAYFSDMLGNRNLATLVQVDGGQGEILRSTALFGGYSNRASRWNWGVVGGQIPSITRQFALTPATTDQGQPALLYQDFRFWQVNRELSGVVEYPFNRARRLELSAGGRSVEFASRIREQLIGPSGRLLAEREVDFTPLDTLSTINQVHGSVALVYDNAVFGATSPMVGQRYRLEVSPTAGSLGYVTALADYRRYVMPIRPFTLAGRVLHLGRYGGGSEDHRLQDYFIGYPSLVRGYEAGSFTFQECPPTDVGSASGFCPAFDRLLGSRFGVFNAEARLPLLGGVGLIPASGVPPVDFLTFFDAGVAWSRGESPRFLGGGRQVVKSYGVGLRINLFGLAVFELDYVNPVDRARKDWFLDFSVTPGF